MEQIFSDLTSVINTIKPGYGTVIQNKGRATKWAALALLADVSLWNGRYQECIDACDQIFATNSYQLAGKDEWFEIFGREILRKVFLNCSGEPETVEPIICRFGFIPRPAMSFRRLHWNCLLKGVRRMPGELMSLMWVTTTKFGNISAIVLITPVMRSVPEIPVTAIGFFIVYRRFIL